MWGIHSLPAGFLPPQWHTPLCSLLRLTLPQRSWLIPTMKKKCRWSRWRTHHRQKRSWKIFKNDLIIWFTCKFTMCLCVCVQGVGSCESPMGTRFPHDSVPVMLCSLLWGKNSKSQPSLISPGNSRPMLHSAVKESIAWRFFQ